MAPYSSYLGFLAAFCTLGQAQRWDLGNGFKLAWDSKANHLSIDQHSKTVFSSVPGQSFLGASSGKDNIVGANGNFKISNVDRNQCQGQNVTQVDYSPSKEGVDAREVTVDGYLLDCEDENVEYSMRFWVPMHLPNRVAFNVTVQPSVDKIYLTLGSDASEDFYGLGAQGSFASMKNQTIPIFSREQGVGRGDEPVTSIENDQSFFSGGNRFTTYTAIPQYISTAGRVFYLGENDTAYASFDFQDPAAVTVRYDARSVSGHFMQAATMLEAITMLTEYTGRMPALPEWVDHGAILGIQGGQEKVKRIINQGFKQDCPVVGVWLQDWYGTFFLSSSVSRDEPFLLTSSSLQVWNPRPASTLRQGEHLPSLVELGTRQHAVSHVERIRSRTARRAEREDIGIHQPVYRKRELEGGWVPPQPLPRGLQGPLHGPECHDELYLDHFQREGNRRRNPGSDQRRRSRLVR